MKKISRTLLAALAITGVLLTSACTNNTEEVDKSETAAIVKVYETVVSNVYNHKQTTEELDTLNTSVTLALGDKGTDYDNALKVLEPAVSLENIYIDEENPSAKLTAALKVLSLMLSNSIGDEVTVKVDTAGINIKENTATIDRKNISFTSVNNTSTGLADTLNAAFQEGGKTKLVLTSDGWKVDISTFYPNV
jgi:seryl-tRNA synthetase